MSAVLAQTLGVLSAAQRAAARAALLHLLDMDAEVSLRCADAWWRPAQGWYYEDGGQVFPPSPHRPFGPEPFTWGRVVRVHVVGDDRIVEFWRNRPVNAKPDWAPHLGFSCFPGGVDAGASCGTLDDAVVFCVAWRRLGEFQTRGVQLNDTHRQVANFRRLTGPVC